MLTAMARNEISEYKNVRFVKATGFLSAEEKYPENFAYELFFRFFVFLALVRYLSGFQPHELARLIESRKDNAIRDFIIFLPRRQSIKIAVRVHNQTGN